MPDTYNVSEDEIALWTDRVAGGANCQAWYLFDEGTGGMIELAGSTFTLISSQAPLFIETDILRLEPAPNP